jgi:hypothetical protein
MVDGGKTFIVHGSRWIVFSVQVPARVTVAQLRSFLNSKQTGFQMLPLPIASLFGLVMCFVPMVFRAWFAMRPSERRLALVRALTLMGVLSAVCNFVLALANGARAVSTMKGLDWRPSVASGPFFPKASRRSWCPSDASPWLGRAR